MGEPMEQLSEDDVCCDWALKAGEIDSFCSSMPNHHQIKFWETVARIEKELHQTAKVSPKASKNIDL